MARSTQHQTSDTDGHGDSKLPAWLKLAGQVKESAPRPEVYWHAPTADASVERVRHLAGRIRLNGPVPSWKFLDDDNDAE
jgi:hypothetical protein